MENIISGEKGRCAVSFSGGKDCTLAAFLAKRAGYTPCALVSMQNTRDEFIALHAGTEVLTAQADAIGLPIVFAETTWETYREVFSSTLLTIKEELDIRHVVFGDIDIEGHRQWSEELCFELGLETVLPLWQKTRTDTVNEFLDLGFEAVISVIDTVKTPEKYLGAPFTRETVTEMQKDGIDPCGENGEFHTIVTNGPLFSKRLSLSNQGTTRQGSFLIYNISAIW